MEPAQLSDSDTSAERAVRDTLLQVADLHFWHITWNPMRLLNKRALGSLNVAFRRRREFDAARAHEHIEALVQRPSRNILLTGDFTSTSLDEEFVQGRAFVAALAERGFTPFVLPGNHDVYTFESARKRRFERYFAEYVPRNGYPSVYTLPGGTSLLLVPTVCPNLLSSRGRVDGRTLRRVEELLADASNPVIVAGHYPVLLRTPGYTLTKERVLRNASALRQAIGESGRRVLYVCGHVHRFSYVRDEVYPGLLHLSTGTFFGRHRHGPADGSFAEIDVLTDGFRVYRHVHVSEWKREPVAPTGPSECETPESFDRIQD